MDNFFSRRDSEEVKQERQKQHLEGLERRRELASDVKEEESERSDSPSESSEKRLLMTCITSLQVNHLVGNWVSMPSSQTPRCLGMGYHGWKRLLLQILQGSPHFSIRERCLAKYSMHKQEYAPSNQQAQKQPRASSECWCQIQNTVYYSGGQGETAPRWNEADKKATTYHVFPR